MNLPAELRIVLDALRPHSSPRLVGGFVRDLLRGKPGKDIDIEVHGISFEKLHRLLSPFGSTDIVGRSFGVIKLRLNGRDYDFSLPRRESKTASGHRGFAIIPDPNLNDTEAAARRDFTINAIAIDPFSGAIIDPFEGQRDLRMGILRHTSSSFSEDPLRVLRAFQFASRFGFAMAPETVALCRSISDAYSELPVERVWGEWAKWGTQSSKPSRGLLLLQETNWLRHFPEIQALIGTPQEPDWHPEGDVFRHTLFCLDALSTLPGDLQPPPHKTLSENDHRRILLLAVLAHDFGKPATTIRRKRNGKLRWSSPQHEQAGVLPAEKFLRRIGAPLYYGKYITPLVKNHLVHHHGTVEFNNTQVRRLARRLDPANIDDLSAVMAADALGRPPLDGNDSLFLIRRLKARAAELSVKDAAPRALIRGRDLVARGQHPGPKFKSILSCAYEAQIEGVFTDMEGARRWLDEHLS